MIYELWHYDIFPKVLCVGQSAKITIRPMGAQAAFRGDDIHIRIMPMENGAFYRYGERNNVFDYHIAPDENGALVFTHTFESEGEHSVRIINEEKKATAKLLVYAVNDDLYGKYAYIGDFHMHTTNSDGREAPEIVAANYRAYGYDFMAITDHHRFYSSLGLIESFKDLPLDLKLYTGEEVHLPATDVHIVNFGGDFSVNALLDTSPQNAGGTDLSLRAVAGAENVPDIMTREEYERECDKAAEKYDIPDGIEKRDFGACVFVFDKIKEAHGLGVFCHPYWISDVYQVPEDFTRFMLEAHPFDAFEVLGGEIYYRENGFQTALYYEMREKGIKVPVLGATDTHSSLSFNPKYRAASTMVFAKENTRDAIVSAVKDCYAVAIDGIPEEKRFVGDFRLIKYATFLYENFFPLHDRICSYEGYLMREYACGDKEAGERLKIMKDDVQKLREKYFGF